MLAELDILSHFFLPGFQCPHLYNEKVRLDDLGGVMVYGSVNPGGGIHDSQVTERERVQGSTI